MLVDRDLAADILLRNNQVSKYLARKTEAGFTSKSLLTSGLTCDSCCLVCPGQDNGAAKLSGCIVQAGLELAVYLR